MPSLYSLNSPPHPFWDFIASLDEGAASTQHSDRAENQQNHAGSTAGEPSQTKAADKQPTVEDEVAAESSSQEKGKAPEAAAQPSNQEPQMPFRGRGRCGGNESARRGHCAGRAGGPCHGRRGGHRGLGESHPRHPRAEAFAGFGDGNLFGTGCPAFRGAGPFGPHRRGPPHGPPPQSSQPGHGPRGGPANFNLADFLHNLGARLGIDLSGSPEDQGLGVSLDRFRSANGNPTTLAEGVDFEPRTDLYDTPSIYVIHISLPGAKREDLGVDWDGENSILHIGGVVHRPGVDEETLKLLAVDGRKKEVGVFEKKIRLGTRRDPAQIDIAAITAKMTDGVLVVKVPKLEVAHQKRDVPISGSSPPASPSGEKQESASAAEVVMDEKAKAADTNMGEEVKTADTNMDLDDARSETEKGEEREMQYEDPAEQLPEYNESGHDSAEGASDEEGEYVKIDVK